MILAAIETQVGGTAKATSNASDRMKVAFSQVQERLGLKLLPVFEKFTKFIIDKVFPAGERLANKWGPVISDAFASIGNAMSKVGDVAGKYLTPILERVGKFFEENEQVVKTFFAVMAGGVVLGAVIALGAALAALLSPAVLITAGIAALVAGIQYAYTNFEGFRKVVDETIATVESVIRDFIGYAQGAWETFGDRILKHAENTWDYIREAIKSAMKIIKGVIDVVTGLISGDWAKVWDGIKAIAQGVWDGITNLIRFALRTIGSILDIAWENIKGAFRTVWDGLASYVDTQWEKIKTGVRLGVDAVIGFIGSLPGRIAGAVGDGFGALWEKFKGVVNRIIDTWNGLSFKFPSFDGDWNGPLPGGGFTVGGWEINTKNIPRLAAGGIVPATPGGRLALLGEGGQDEAVIPLSKLGTSGGAPINIYVSGLTGPQVADDIADKLMALRRRNGRLPWE
jgi:phage-related protein